MPFLQALSYHVLVPRRILISRIDYGFSIIRIPHKNFNYCPLGKSRPVNTSPIAKSTTKQTTFYISRGETFGGVAECRLFSQAKAI